jgi:hypothetical protein
MKSIFLCHSSKDKLFVESLAENLQGLGIKVWYDKWEIKVGESISRKINDGIGNNEYLGIVLSPDSVASEWVWAEFSAAWFKQMTTKKIIVLPILYRECEIPVLLKDRKYADFRKNFDQGFEDLATTLGVDNNKIVSIDTWRNYVRQDKEWKDFRLLEYKKIVTRLVDLAIEYKWSVWVGGRGKFSLTLSADFPNKISRSISVILNKKNNKYKASFEFVINPNTLHLVDFSEEIGDSINECEEFVWRFLENNKNKLGSPEGTPRYFTTKFLNFSEVFDITKESINLFRKYSDYYEGDKLFNLDNNSPTRPPLIQEIVDKSILKHKKICKAKASDFKTDRKAHN